MHGILFVETGLSGGGSFVSLFQHLKVIDRERFRPTVVFLNENHFVEKIQALDISVYVLTDGLYSEHGPRWRRALLRRIAHRVRRYAPSLYLEFARVVHRRLIKSLKRIVDEESIEIIHLNNNVYRNLSGVLVAEHCNIHCISHLRSNPDARFPCRLARYSNRIVSFYIANSRATKTFWESKGIDPTKVEVVHNAVPEAVVEPLDIRGTWGVADHVKYVLGCIGTLNPSKGHQFLLRAFGKFVKDHPDAVLLLVGDGPLRDKLVLTSREMGLKDSVIFVGHEERAQEIMAGLDLLIVPSRDEAFGRVVIEAMMVGTPVVATDVGGIPEIIDHKHNGLLLQYGDEEMLSRAMEEVLLDENLRATLIKNGRCTARERFDIKRYALGIEGIYETVLRESRRL